MENQTSLFVILDPEAQHQVALLKALLIAKLGNCRIHAFLCIHREFDEGVDASSKQDLKSQALAEAGQWLEQQLEPCKQVGIPCSSELVWKRKWCDRALRSIAKSDCDLVIKSSFHHSRFSRFYSVTSDYKLMRNCARPILFAHQEQQWQSDQMLACIDLVSRDVQHERLNAAIMRNAKAMQDLFAMDLNVAVAYESEIDSEHLPIKGRVDAQSLAELYQVEPERIFLRQGPAATTIRAICDELEPDILIMGTLARRGISGKIIGNTAEKLLDLVAADLLTIN